MTVIIARLKLLPFALLLSACSQSPIQSHQTKTECVCAPLAASTTQKKTEQPDLAKAGASSKPETSAIATSPISTNYSLLRPANWTELEGYNQDNLSAAWSAWLQSCSVLKNRQPYWQKVCLSAATLNKPNNSAIQAYFKQNFTPYRSTNADSSDTGLITGYYQPRLSGSRTKTNVYRYPLYSKPDDLITVELGSLFPELANKRVRGRLVNNKLVPYYNRAEIGAETSPLRGKELFWVDDEIDLFFLQIQGSGLIALAKEEPVHVGYADQNGLTYQSIGRLLVDRGELTLEKASMQSIKDWARNNPNRLQELLNNNPSYVFFRELPAGLPGPLGSLGVPIVAERSVAIDPQQVPLGAPIFLSTTYPNNSKPLQRLMMAQDTGGAIKGGVRADVFWGAGQEAGKLAGAMKQKGKIWVLLPKDMPLSP
ncbi:MAG: murein transglycosylase A [Methylophilaceae bacterium]